jgi:hypothetical protein
MTTGRTAGRAIVAAGGARLGFAALTRWPPGGEKTWTRTNHRGEPVTLLEGPALTVAATTAAAAVPGLAADWLALALAGARASGAMTTLAGAA